VKSGAVDEPVKLADGWAYGDDHDSSWSSLPRKVVEWAGLNNHFHRTDPWVSYKPDGEDGRTERCSLSGINDAGESFETIANLIEEQL
jgi:hypothetical protein